MADSLPWTRGEFPAELRNYKYTISHAEYLYLSDALQGQSVREQSCYFFFFFKWSIELIFVFLWKNAQTTPPAVSLIRLPGAVVSQP